MHIERATKDFVRCVLPTQKSYRRGALVETFKLAEQLPEPTGRAVRPHTEAGRELLTRDWPLAPVGGALVAQSIAPQARTLAENCVWWGLRRAARDAEQPPVPLPTSARPARSLDVAF